MHIFGQEDSSLRSKNTYYTYFEKENPTGPQRVFLSLSTGSPNVAGSSSGATGTGTGGGDATAKICDLVPGSSKKHRRPHRPTRKATESEQLGDSVPGPSKGCPMDYPTLPIGFHWEPLRGSWYIAYIAALASFAPGVVPPFGEDR